MQKIFIPSLTHLCGFCACWLLINGSQGLMLFAADNSSLWGGAGEQWDPTDRLPEFSYAGYHHGNDPIPEVPVVANVRDFGARGDASHDDSQAFLQAIASVDQGAILVPAGRYVIRRIIPIEKSHIVLRGEGPRESILFCPVPLEEIRPNMGATTGGRPTSNYSWSGGFLWVKGDYRSTELARINKPASRGAREVQVADAQAVRVGQWIEVQQRDTRENSLAASLYAGDPGKTEKLRGRTRASLTAQITKVEGDRVRLNRALPFDIKLEWRPRLLRFAPTVSEVGIEDLGFAFPNTPYEGHFTELGFNPIAISDAAHCWARNLRFFNADSGIFASGRFCTFADIVYDSERQVEPSRHSAGHHGIYLSDQDNLFTRFRFNVRFIHDLTVSHCSGNVCSAGSGVDVCFDHHKRAPFANLFTDIDIGQGTRMYQCGGGADLGKNAGAWTTFWNIRADRPQSWPPRSFGPAQMNLIGVFSEQPTVLEPNGKWFEPTDRGGVTPRDLHQAQVERRKTSSNTLP